MADSVNDDLGPRDLVEIQIRIRRRAQTPNRRIIGANTSVWMGQEQIDDVLYVSLYGLRAFRRMGGFIVEN
jgi:hypothetical protein